MLVVLVLMLTAPFLLHAQVLLEGGGPPPPGFLQFQPGPEYEAQLKELETVQKPGTATGGDKLSAGCGIFSVRLACVVYWILDALTDLVVTTFASLVSLLFNAMVNTALATNLAATPFVTLGFNITLGVANMFFVLILLWIAIATIFDFEPYTARSLLLRLIIAALLINFSLAIGSSFIRLSNGIARVFHSQLLKTPEARPGEVSPTKDYIPATGIARRVMLMSNYAAIIDTAPNSRKEVRAVELEQVITEGKCKEETDPFSGLTFATCATAEAEAAWEERFRSPKNSEDSLLTALQAIFWKLLMVPVLIFVLFAGIIFIIIRQVSLAFILVLGPLAFLLMILPATRALYNQWWEQLFKWSFFFPAFMFFLFLSLGVGSQLLPANLASANEARLPIMLQYFMTVALLIGSLMVANKLGIYGASTVTGWGKAMGKGIGKYAAARGWKYAGKAAEQLAKIPGVGRIAPLRAGVTAVMKKGAAVEKKDIDFYTKLPDRQLGNVLSGMRATQRNAILGALPGGRLRQTKDQQLRNLAIAAGVLPAAAAVSPQNQAIQDQVMAVVQGLDALRDLPETLRNAMIQGIRQAIQNLPGGTTPQAAAQAVTQAAQNVAQAQPPTVQVLAQPAVNAIRSQGPQIQIQSAVERALRAAAARPAAPAREELEERLDALEERLGGAEERLPPA